MGLGPQCSAPVQSAFSFTGMPVLTGIADASRTWMGRVGCYCIGCSSPAGCPSWGGSLCQPSLTFPRIAARREDSFSSDGRRRDLFPPRLTETGFLPSGSTLLFWYYRGYRTGYSSTVFFQILTEHRYSKNFFVQLNPYSYMSRKKIQGELRVASWMETENHNALQVYLTIPLLVISTLN